MTVALDTFIQDNAQGTGTLTFTYTPVGTAKGILIGIAQEVGFTDEVTSVLYGASAMIRIAFLPYGTGETGAVYVYQLLTAVPAGAQTVTVNVNATASNKFAMGISLTGAADLEVVDFDTSIATITANPSGTLQLGGRTCFCCEFFYSGHATIGNITAIANWTIKGSGALQDFGATQCGCHTFNTIGSSDATFGYTAASDDAVIIAVAISEVVPPSVSVLAQPIAVMF